MVLIFALNGKPTSPNTAKESCKPTACSTGFCVPDRATQLFCESSHRFYMCDRFWYKNPFSITDVKMLFIADVFVRNRQPSVLMSFPGAELTYKKFVPVYFLLYRCVFFFLFQSDQCNRTFPGVKVIGKSIYFMPWLKLFYRTLDDWIVPEIEFYPTGIFL